MPYTSSTFSCRFDNVKLKVTNATMMAGMQMNELRLHCMIWNRTHIDSWLYILARQYRVFDSKAPPSRRANALRQCPPGSQLNSKIALHFPAQSLVLTAQYTIVSRLLTCTCTTCIWHVPEICLCQIRLSLHLRWSFFQGTCIIQMYPT